MLVKQIRAENSEPLYKWWIFFKKISIVNFFPNYSLQGAVSLALGLKIVDVEALDWGSNEIKIMFIFQSTASVCEFPLATGTVQL